MAAVGSVDVVVIAAPIAEHVRLAELALTGGADVLLEKPPVAAFDDFTRLLAAERRTGRVVQVGFQSLGSHGLKRLREDAFGIGNIVKVTAMGAWSRTVGYWNRSPWAGRRSLHGQPVVDGVVTNPLAHATATALAVIGCREAEDVAAVDTDLYRANAIDSDDTSVVRIQTTSGMTVTCAFTLCASTQEAPVVYVEGSRGRAAYAYTEDKVDIELDGQTRTVRVGRDNLLENLLAFRRGEASLSSPWPVRARSCAFWMRSPRPASPYGSTREGSRGLGRVRTADRWSPMWSRRSERPWSPGKPSRSWV